MQRTQLGSTAIRSTGYDAATLLLEIEFTGGGVYEYAAVPASVHRALLDAPSHGRYFNRAIRDHFDYRRLG
ncbi:KTSC domain-containing protein [Kitasatospora sp. NPDC050543]|uniref:KTSC domain-containing protein n=1 Tax=Kitasatospora sp. NPDC050543 TaxID=3364054 RepID=UPI0037930819